MLMRIHYRKGPTLQVHFLQQLFLLIGRFMSGLSPLGRVSEVILESSLVKMRSAQRD